MCESTIPEYTPGGRALGFTATVDLRLRRGDWISEGTGDNKHIVGQVVKFRVDKNKTFKRMQSGEFDFYFDINNAGVKPGFNDYLKEIIACAVEWGIITRAGTWFNYKDLKFKGLAALIENLRSDPSLVEGVKKEVESVCFASLNTKGLISNE